MKKQDRILGALLGAVTGDALGVPVEFRSRRELEKDPVRGMRGRGTHDQPEGTWSDDTSMALCLAESILERGWDLEDQAERYARWAFEHHWTPHGETFDIGGTTGASLDRFRHGTTAASCGGSGERDNGNGALMRILPAAIWFSGAPDEMLVRALSDASAITHAHGRSRLASVCYGLLVRALLEGMPPREALRSAADALRRITDQSILDEGMEQELPALSRILDLSVCELSGSEIGSSGYVIDTLEASFWCLVTTSSYEECVLQAVNLGGDTDTTGTVAGGLAGLLYGAGAIPPAWLQSLARTDEVQALLRSLTELTLRPVPHTASYWVLPGKLLAGEYPRNRDQESSEQKLDALLRAGVSACVDLTERGEYGLLSYDELLDARALLRAQLREPEQDSTPPFRCTTDRFPIPDGGVTGEATVREAHGLIRKKLRSGESVYVHCWGGHGRTGLIVGTWLVDSGLTTPERTQAALTHLRRGIDDADHPSPETKRQIAMLLSWSRNTIVGMEK